MLDKITNNKKIFWIVVILGICVMLGMMLFGITNKEFWYDEMAIIGFMRSGTSFAQMVGYYLNIEASNLPLYQIIVSIFYKLFPPAELYVLIPSMLFTIVGVVLVVMLTDKMSGRIAAYTVLLLSVVSTTIITRMGILLRAYSLMFFGTIASLYCIFLIKENEKRLWYILETVSLFLLVYSHYFGTLMFGMLGVFTLLGCILKKCKLRCLIPYVIDSILFAPWFLLAMKTRVKTVDNFWIEKPSLKSVAETIGYLLGGNYIACALWGVASVVCMILFIKRKEYLSYKTVVVVLPVVVIGIIFVFSYVMGSLYENRYFIILLPEILLTIGMFFQEIVNKFKENKFGNLCIILEMVCIGIIMIGMFGRCYGDAGARYVRFAGAANYIVQEGDIENNNTLLVIRDYDAVDSVTSMGWYDYYLHRRGYDANNIEILTIDFVAEVIDDYGDSIDKVYIFAPIDLAQYNEDRFEMIFQEYNLKLTVLERKKGE